MKLNKKLIALAIVCLAALAFGAGCSHRPTQYEINNSENYTVSVKYDANGGTFTTNTPVIVHTYNIDGLKTNEEGLIEIPLVTPDNEEAGNKKFVPTRNGYFFAGWYKERIDTPKANGKTNYTYADMWDFENDRHKVDPKKEHTSENADLTLYAAWIPLFKINYHDAATGELISVAEFNPLENKSFTLPSPDEKTGGVKVNDFPERPGYTFNKAYLDKEMTAESLVNTAELTHPGIVNYETGTAENPVLDVYVDWTEGEWFKISTAEQFEESASVSGHYEILADLDFTDVAWTFVNKKFQGEIIGNGHTFMNITINQTNLDASTAGLFGALTEAAKLSDITFENVTLNIERGSRKAGATFGLFAGTISEDASISNVKLTNSTMTIVPDCYFDTTDYSIGRICGMGDSAVIQTENITCPETAQINVDNKTVTITIS